MDKTYTIGEVMIEYEKNGYKGSFQKDDGTILNYGDTFGITFNDSHEVWRKIDIEVDFITAVKAFRDGETVYCINSIGAKFIYKRSISIAMKDQNDIAVGTDEILNGKWFIKNE